MKRKIYNELIKWKLEDDGKSALLIEGARRIGKSYIVEEFGRNEYKSYLLIDFSHVEKQVITYFEEYATDLDALFMHLSLHFHTKLYPRNSLIIFDEVQTYPPARAAIKHLVADGRFDYIETGSLVSIRRNVKDILIPSEEVHLQMFPMDFEEFLWALGDEMMMPFIRQCFENRQPLGSLHRRAMDYFRQYMIVGGMPQAVAAFAQSHDFMKAEKEKRKIVDLYRADIQKYAIGNESKVTTIFDNIPGQLQKHEKKFRLSSLRNDAKMRDYESSFLWLQDSQVVNICYNATEPNLGLRLKMDNTTLKCYFGDTGLLITHSFDENLIRSGELFRKLMLDKLEINKGMLVENLVAQMLRTQGHKLYFYSRYSDVADDRMEIDFLVAKPVISNRHNISPIEVKSTNRYTTVSLEKFIKKYGQYLATPYIIHSADYFEKDGITYIPFYMTPLL